VFSFLDGHEGFLVLQVCLFTFRGFLLLGCMFVEIIGS